MDWITCCVEAIGLVILCVWVVVPIREFGTIIRRLRVRRPDDPKNPTHGHPRE